MSKSKFIPPGLLLMLGLLLVGLVSAQQSANVTLSWHLLGAGSAATSTAGEVTLNASLGQPVIGSANSETTELRAGYWAGVAVRQTDHTVYLPIIVNQASTTN
ncbi:MAG: hypothetical protein KC419_10485 [Anaerolineales bacterium]|nr:hypothetical protein [Anaerolineales bacterium]